MFFHAILTLSSRVKESNEGGWKKLLCVMNFLKNTRDDILTLEVDNSQELIWYVDEAFAVHPNMKSHTRAVLPLVTVLLYLIQPNKNPMQ